MAGAAPDPPGGSAEHLAIRPAEEDGEERAVGDSGGLHVELIEAVGEKAGVRGVGVGLDDEVWPGLLCHPLLLRRVRTGPGAGQGARPHAPAGYPVSDAIR